MKNGIVPYLVLICMTLVFVEKPQALPRPPQLPLPEMSPVIGNGWTAQVHTLSPDGTMRIDKLGHHVIRGPNQERGTAQ